MKREYEQFAVQPHSQGPIYPAVIATVERYGADGALDFQSFALTLDGRTVEYATYDDAHSVARALVTNSELRRQWRGEPAAQPVAEPPERYPSRCAYGAGFCAYCRRP